MTDDQELNFYPCPTYLSSFLTLLLLLFFIFFFPFSMHSERGFQVCALPVGNNCLISALLILPFTAWNIGALQLQHSRCHIVFPYLLQLPFHFWLWLSQFIIPFFIPFQSSCFLELREHSCCLLGFCFVLFFCNNFPFLASWESYSSPVFSFVLVQAGLSSFTSLPSCLSFGKTAQVAHGYCCKVSALGDWGLVTTSL